MRAGRTTPDPARCLASGATSEVALPLEPGPVDTLACRESTRANDGANEVGPTGSTVSRWRARAPAWLVGRLRLGRACQHRPARSLHPGRGGRTRLPPRELLPARLNRPRLVEIAAVGFVLNDTDTTERMAMAGQIQ